MLTGNARLIQKLLLVENKVSLPLLQNSFHQDIKLNQRHCFVKQWRRFTKQWR